MTRLSDPDECAERHGQCLGRACSRPGRSSTRCCSRAPGRRRRRTCRTVSRSPSRSPARSRPRHDCSRIASWPTLSPYAGEDGAPVEVVDVLHLVDRAHRGVAVDVERDRADREQAQQGHDQRVDDPCSLCHAIPPARAADLIGRTLSGAVGSAKSALVSSLSVVSRQQPEQQPPPVQRLRVRYAKRGRLRFTSHRDFSRAFERAVFRAAHPDGVLLRLQPAPAHLLRRCLTHGCRERGRVPRARARRRARPRRGAPAARRVAAARGSTCCDVVVSAGGSLSDLLQASRWRVEADVPRDEAERAVAAFLAAPEVPVERMTKKGMRTFDARGAVRSLAVATTPPMARAPHSSWCCSTVSRPCEPTTCSPAWRGWAGWISPARSC